MVHREGLEPSRLSTPDSDSGTGNQTYAVYSAPTKKSIRGAKGKARVSTNGWIQVFGAEEDWILVQYDISDKQNRIGYIYINALPKDVTVPDLNLKRAVAVTNYDVEVTDDPLVSHTPLAKLTENTKVTCLGTMGTWTYIEAKENDVLFRGFVPTECLSGTVTTLREAEKAIVGSWKLYAGFGECSSSTVITSQTTQLEDISPRICGKGALQFGCQYRIGKTSFLSLAFRLGHYIGKKGVLESSNDTNKDGVADGDEEKSLFDVLAKRGVDVIPETSNDISGWQGQLSLGYKIVF